MTSFQMRPYFRTDSSRCSEKMIHELKSLYPEKLCEYLSFVFCIIRRENLKAGCHHAHWLIKSARISNWDTFVVHSMLLTNHPDVNDKLSASHVLPCNT